METKKLTQNVESFSAQALEKIKTEIQTDEDLGRVEAVYSDAKDMVKMIRGELEPARKKAKAAYDEIRDLRDRLLKEPNRIITQTGLLIARYRQRKKAEAAEAKRKADEARRQEEERLRKEAEKDMEKAIDAMESGDEEEADLRMRMAARKEEEAKREAKRGTMGLAQEAKAAAPPKSKSGVYTIETWYAEIENENEIPRTINIDGRPFQLMIPNTSELGAIARKYHDQIKVPGVVFKSKTSTGRR